MTAAPWGSKQSHLGNPGLEKRHPLGPVETLDRCEWTTGKVYLNLEAPWPARDKPKPLQKRSCFIVLAANGKLC